MIMLLESFVKLKKYCEKESYRGWDPYDGLNSKIFNKIPLLKNSAICRLIMIQLFKRNPVNLRKIALVPKEYNAKGIGLFLSGYCNLYKIVESKPHLANKLGSLDNIKIKINYLAELLIRLQSKGSSYHGACWGYNFDWQARRLFLFPKFTPTVVATHFCALGLMDAYEITKNDKYLQIALSSAEFVTKDLHRTKCENGFLFSYSTIKGNDTVINASLLGSGLLSRCYKYTNNEEYLQLAKESVKACLALQNNDGSWPYGLLKVQSWVDSFHTGYNLDGVYSFLDICENNVSNAKLDRGFNYYIKSFFLPNGEPKYYNNKLYPIDIHCPGQLFITLSVMKRFKENEQIAEKVLNWTILNMQDKKGYFYYQLKPRLSSKISYMRWSNAFMFNALSHYLKCKYVD